MSTEQTPSPAPVHQVVGQTFSPNGESCPHCGRDECCGGFMAVEIIMGKREREELLALSDRKRELLAARVRHLERCLRQIEAASAEYFDQESGPGIPPGVRRGLDYCAKVQSVLTACLPNPRVDLAGASPAQVQRVVGCELSNGEKP